MNIRAIIKNEINSCRSTVRVEPMPESKKASLESFKKLDAEIKEQFRVNRALWSE